MNIKLDPTKYGQSLKLSLLQKIIHYFKDVNLTFFYVEGKQGKELLTAQYTSYPPTLTAVTKEQFNAWKKYKIGVWKKTNNTYTWEE